MDIALLISSLNAAKTMAGLLIEERDRQKAAAIQIDLTEKIVQAQAQLAEVLGAIISKDATIHALSERNRELEAAKSERARYELAETRVGGQQFAYRLRLPAELTERRDEPAHFLCQRCFDVGKKEVLMLFDSLSHGPAYECFGCKAVLAADRSG